MKVLVALALLCLLQAIAGQVSKNGDKLGQHNQGVQENKQENSHITGNKGQEIHTNDPNKINEQQAATQNQHQVQNLAQPHVTEQQKPIVNSQHSKVSVEIPPKVQQVVNQVSQHVPIVIAQHVANKQRMVRSIKNSQAWQAMQVNPIEQPGKCEFLCNQQDLKVCGYNGLCYLEFDGQCDLSTYNCLNTQKKFHVVDFSKCQDIGVSKCYRGDL